jgi:hypothetical protein
MFARQNHKGRCTTGHQLVASWSCVPEPAQGMDCLLLDGFLSPAESNDSVYAGVGLEPDFDQLIGDCDHLLGSAATWFTPRPPSPELDILCCSDTDDGYDSPIISPPMVEPSPEDRLRCTDTTDEELEDTLQRCERRWTVAHARCDMAARVREPVTTRVVYVDGRCIVGGVRTPPPQKLRTPRPVFWGKRVIGRCEDCQRPFISPAAFEKHNKARRYPGRFPCLITTCTAVFAARGCRDRHIVHTHV